MALVIYKPFFIGIFFSHNVTLKNALNDISMLRLWSTVKCEGATSWLLLSRVATAGGDRVSSRLGASLPPLREEEVAGPACFPRDSNPHPGKTLSLGASLVAGSGREPTCADAFWKMPHKGEFFHIPTFWFILTQNSVQVATPLQKISNTNTLQFKVVN